MLKGWIRKSPICFAVGLLLLSVALVFLGVHAFPVIYQKPLLLTALAGLSTGVGSLIFLIVKNQKQWHLVFALGLSSGAMIYVSFVELLRIAIQDVGFIKANAVFLLGLLLMALLDTYLPHRYLDEMHPSSEKGRLLSTGRMVAMGLAIHNIPEGMAVFISSTSDIHLGVALALAIAIHNIPEGIAVAAPVYHATQDRFKAFLWSYASGVAEPIGALLAIFFLHEYLTTEVTAYCFALVAGIMTFISFDELLPAALRQPHLHQTAILGIGLGLFVVMLSLMPI